MFTMQQGAPWSRITLQKSSIDDTLLCRSPPGKFPPIQLPRTHGRLSIRSIYQASAHIASCDDLFLPSVFISPGKDAKEKEKELKLTVDRHAFDMPSSTAAALRFYFVVVRAYGVEGGRLVLVLLWIQYWTLLLLMSRGVSVLSCWGTHDWVLGGQLQATDRHPGTKNKRR